VLALGACTSGKQLHGTKQDLPGGNVLHMGMLAPDFAWVLTDRRFVSTQNDGKVWHDHTPIDTPGPSLRGALFFDIARAWTVADQGGKLVVYRSASGGNSWRTTELGTFDGVTKVDIDFVSPTNGILAVQSATTTLFRTGDGGAVWTKLPPVAATGTYEVDLATEQLAFAVPSSHDALLQSNDGGATWTRATWLPATFRPAGCADARAPACRVSTSLRVGAPSVERGDIRLGLTYLAGAPRFVALDAKVGGARAASAAAVALAKPPAGRLPVAYLRDRALTATDGQFLYRAAPRCCETTATSGLPSLPSKLSFGSATSGWAVATNAGHVDLYSTADGGKTWTKLVP
jgi:hypothetical protein